MKVIAEAMAFLRLRGMIIAYLNDLLLFAASAEQLTHDLEFTKDFLRSLGWLLNLKVQSGALPAHYVPEIFVGLQTIREYFCHKKKYRKLNGAMSLLQSNQPVTIRRTMLALGLLNSAIPAVQWVGLHFRPLQRFILKVWDHSQASLDAQVSVPPQVKRSRWWCRAKGEPVTGSSVGQSGYKNRDHRCRGWGAHLGPLITQGAWKGEELQRSSNWKELRAVSFNTLGKQDRSGRLIPCLF